MPGRAGVIVPFLFIGVKMIKSIKQIFLETNWEEAELEYRIVNKFYEMIDNSKNFIERHVAYRFLYKYFNDIIIKYSEENKRFRINLDYYRFIRYFTPIEHFVYDLTRINRTIQLHPQYPVGKYILDFGNPYFKIGVECDGKEFHNFEKDHNRDLDLYNNYGWKIYRIKGVECYSKYKNKYRFESDFFEHNNEIDNEEKFLFYDYFYNNMAEGILMAISHYYLNEHSYMDRYSSTINNSLKNHNLINLHCV